MSVIDQEISPPAPALRTTPDAATTVTLAKLMRRVEEDSDLAPTQRRDLLSSLRALARGVGQPASSRRTDFVLPLDAFPASFAADLAAWPSVVSGGNMFDERAPARPLRPRTVTHEAMVLRHFASALVHHGVDPVAIERLADLVEPDRFKLALRCLIDRRGGQLTPGLASMPASSWPWRVTGRADADTVRALKRLAARVSCSGPRLTAEDRRRLTQFDDRRNIARLLHVPDRLVDLALVLGDERR